MTIFRFITLLSVVMAFICWFILSRYYDNTTAVAQSTLDIENLVDNLQVINSPYANKFVFYERRITKVIAISLIFKGGAYLDQQHPGLQHFLASLMTSASGDFDIHEFSEFLKINSIRLSFKVERDYTQIILVGLSNKKEALFTVMDMIINNPNFSMDHINIVRDSIINKLQSSSNIQDELHKILFSTLYSNDLGFQPIMGTVDSVNSINQQLLQDAYYKFMGLNNLFVAVSGNIAVQEVKSKFYSILSKLPKGTKVVFNNYQPNFTAQNITVDLDGDEVHKDVDHVLLVLDVPINQDNRVYLRLLNGYLGGVNDSLLNNKLISEKHLGQKINSYLIYNNLSTIWAIYAVAEYKNRTFVVQEILDTIYHLKISDHAEEIKTVSNWYLQQQLRFFINNESIAQSINFIQFYEDLNDYIVKLQKLRVLDMQVFQKIIDSINKENVIVISGTIN